MCNNLLNLNTPNLDLFSGSVNQFFFIITSNLNNLNQTTYYSYLQSNTISSSESGSIRFTII
jgi:hypothetical protein